MEYFNYKNYIGVSLVLLIVGLVQQLIVVCSTACPVVLGDIVFSMQYYFLIMALIWIWAIFTVIMTYKECKSCMAKSKIAVKEVKAVNATKKKVVKKK